MRAMLSITDGETTVTIVRENGRYYVDGEERTLEELETLCIYALGYTFKNLVDSLYERN